MYNVLVVDDHHIFRATILAFLQTQTDIQVVGEAANGLEAVELTRALHPDVVVMDVSMPVMNGIEATRRIKLENPKVRVICLSAFEEAQIWKEIERAGAEACLSKITVFVNDNDQPQTLLELIRSMPGRAGP